MNNIKQTLINKWIEHKNLIILLWISSVILYLGYITELLPCPDAVLNPIYYKTTFLWEMMQGRYMLGLLQALTGFTVSPGVFTVLGLLLLGIILTAIVDFLGIQGLLWQYLAAMIMLASPNIQSTLTYYYCGFFYIIAYALAVLALILATHSYSNRTKTILGLILSSILFSLSLGIYQTYISTVVTLGLFHVILKLSDENTTIKEVGAEIFHMLTGFISGIILYLICNKICLYSFNTTNVDARGFSKMGRVPLSSIPTQLKYCLHCWKQYFLGTELINNDYGWIPRRYINLLFLFILFIIILFFLFTYRYNLLRLTQLSILLIMTPIATTVLFLAAPEVSASMSTGSLMFPAINMTYVLPIMLLNTKTYSNISSVYKLSSIKIIIRSSKYILAVSIILVCVFLSEMALDGQAYQRYNMKKMESVGNALAEKIAQVTADQPIESVCIVGCMENGNYPDAYLHLKKSIQWLTSSKGMLWGNYVNAIDGWRCYLRDYHGITINPCFDENKYSEILQTDEYSNMSLFPGEKGTAVIDGVLVIKLSDALDY